MGWLFKSKKGIEKVSKSDSINSPSLIECQNDLINENTNNLEDTLDEILNNPYFFKLGEDSRFLIGYMYSFKPDTFNIIFFNKLTASHICKSWEKSPGKSLSCYMFAVSAQAWFAITLDEYDETNPHTVRTVILYDNLGNEHLSMHYATSGFRNYGFSSSGKYFVLMGHDSFHVYDTLSGHMDVFFPDDMGNTSSLDFIILEDQHLVTFCYTQHPDQPWYHFKFNGQLIEQGAFKAQLEKKNEPSEETKAFYALFNELDNSSRPLSSEDYERFLSKLVSYAKDPDYESAWLYRKIGELEMEMDHKSSALSYFKKALTLDPQIGVKRIASKLEKELSQ